MHSLRSHTSHGLTPRVGSGCDWDRDTKGRSVLAAPRGACAGLSTAHTLSAGLFSSTAAIMALVSTFPKRKSPGSCRFGRSHPDVCAVSSLFLASPVHVNWGCRGEQEPDCWNVSDYAKRFCSEPQSKDKGVLNKVCVWHSRPCALKWWLIEVWKAVWWSQSGCGLIVWRPLLSCVGETAGWGGRRGGGRAGQLARETLRGKWTGSGDIECSVWEGEAKHAQGSELLNWREVEEHTLRLLEQDQVSRSGRNSSFVWGNGDFKV